MRNSITIILLVLLLHACKEEKPEEVAQQFISALNSSDYELAKQLCDEETKAYVDQQQSNMEAVDATLSEQYSQAKIEVKNSGEKSGDTLIFNYKASNIPGERQLMLVKRNKKWLVHNTFDEESGYAPLGEPTFSEEISAGEDSTSNTGASTEF